MGAFSKVEQIWEGENKASSQAGTEQELSASDQKRLGPIEESLGDFGEVSGFRLREFTVFVSNEVLVGENLCQNFRFGADLLVFYMEFQQARRVMMSEE